MVSSRSLVFFLSAVFILTAQLAVARPDFLYHFCLNDKGNYSTANSTYMANFNNLLFSLSSNTEIDRGFYHSAYGQNSDRVYGIGLCRGDVNPDVCRGCLNNAASLLTKLCPNQKEAIGWYDECMLRYSNRSILGIVETSPSFYMWNPNNLSANYVEQFNGDLRTLLEILRSQAAAGGPDLKFAAGNTTAPNFQTLYALVQCTPDLSQQDCNNCLVGAFQRIPQCCDGKLGGRVVMPSCNIRFEVYPFYNPTTAASPRSTPTKTSVTTKREAGDSKRSSIFVINIFVLIVAAIVLSISIGLGVFRSVKRKWNNDGPSNEITRVEMESLQVDDGSEAKGGYFYERYTQIRKKLSSIREKKDRSFVGTAIDDENEIPGLISHSMPDGSSESDDDSVSQLLRERLRSLKGLRHPSSSSPRSSHVSQLTRELNEYKWRCEEAERVVHRQQEKISSVHKEMQEEVNSMKRQQTQQQQEMEAKQKQMEQQIEFLLSQLQLRKDPHT